MVRSASLAAMRAEGSAVRVESFRVRKFRNIQDSGEVRLDDRLTCLVGKNQSGKTALLEAAAGAVSAEVPGLSTVLSLSSTATFLLLLWFLFLVRGGTARKPAAMSAGLAVPWASLVVAALVLVWLLPWFDIPRLRQESLKSAELGQSLWPVALGAALYAGGSLLFRQRPARIPTLPAGDLVIPLEMAVKRGRRALQTSAGDIEEIGHHLRARLARALSGTGTRGGRILALEQDLASWTWGAAFFLVLTGLLLLLALA
jgi:hypothetical protein